MESLLSVSFDNIASKDTSKIRKGLRQAESLLAQICLWPSASPVEQSLLDSPRRLSCSSSKPLDALPSDRAYQEFFRLQQSFEWNVATKAVDCLSRLLGMGNGTVIDSLIASTLETLLGVLLLHGPSTSLFSREINMNLLVDLLDPSNRAQIILCTIDVLTASLLDRPQNVRVFENVDGLHTMTSLYQSTVISADIKSRVADFFHVYLLPEQPMRATPQQQSPSKSSSLGGIRSFGDGTILKTAEEKEGILGTYLGHAVETL